MDIHYGFGLKLRGAGPGYPNLDFPRVVFGLRAVRSVAPRASGARGAVPFGVAADPLPRGHVHWLFPVCCVFRF